MGKTARDGPSPASVECGIFLVGVSIMSSEGGLERESLQFTLNQDTDSRFDLWTTSIGGGVLASRSSH